MFPLTLCKRVLRAAVVAVPLLLLAPYRVGAISDIAVRETNPRVLNGDLLERGRRWEASIVNDMRWAGSSNPLLDVDTLTSPGMVVGITTYDLQHNSSQGHQVAGRPDGTVHMVWTYWDHIPQSADERDRYVRYNSWNGSTFNQGFDGAVISLATWARSGFTRMDVDSKNLSHVTLQQFPESGAYNYKVWHIFMPNDGLASHFDKALPDSVLSANYSFQDVAWPDIAITANGLTTSSNDEDVFHIISTGAIDNGTGTALPSDELAYWRFDSDTIDNPEQQWSQPVIIDSSETLEYVIDAADDGTGKVAVAFTNNSEPQFNELLNLGYRESFTEGLGWIDGTELGDSYRTWITDHNDDMTPGPQVWGYVSIAYDHASNLHITWIEQREANTTPDQNRLMHWSDVDGQVTTVVEAYYDNDGNYPGAQNLNYATLGIGDGSSMCTDVGRTNEDFLYVVYSQHCGPTQEEMEDKSANGICNAELYFTASVDSGRSWTLPVNLSNTKTPRCNPTSDPDSVCSSEQWATIARDVSAINITYILDREAGDYSSSGWVFNDYMYLTFPAGTNALHVCPLYLPYYASDLTGDPECEYHAMPGGVNIEQLTIANLGNAYLQGSIDVTAGQSFLSATPSGPFTISPTDPPLDVSVTMDAGSLIEGLYYGTLEITHNDTTKISTTDVYPIEFFVVDDFHCPEIDILRSGVASPGVLALEVGSDGRFAHDCEGGMLRHMDSSSALTEATLAIAHGPQGPDTLVFHRFFEASPSDPGQHGYRSLADLEIDTSQYSTGQGMATALARMTTRDSLLDVKAEWFFPQDPDSADFIIVEYSIANRTNQLDPGHLNYNDTLTDVVVGLWGDWTAKEAARLHVQACSDNDGYYIADSNFVYVYGRDTAGHDNGGDHLLSSKRYSGGVTYLWGRNGGEHEIAFDPQPIHAGIGDNRENTAVNGGPTSGLFYRKLVGGPGVVIFSQYVDPDSNGKSDLYEYLTLDQGLTLAPGERQNYVIGLLSDTLGHWDYPEPVPTAGITSLHATLAKCWAFAVQNGFPKAIGCDCPTHGDPVTDGIVDVFDVVRAVDVAFRSATPEQDFECPWENTDVSCDGVSDVFDVVAYVDVAFRSGDAAILFCDACQ